MRLFVGLLLAVQGVGGAINNATGGAESWFLLNHIEALDGYQLPLHIVMALLGVALVGVPELLKSDD